MIIEIFIVVLVLLKVFGVLNLSLVTTSVIIASLSAVRIHMYLDKRSLAEAMLKMAREADNIINQVRFDIDQKKDQDQ